MNQYFPTSDLLSGAFDPDNLPKIPGMMDSVVQMPDAEYQFLHEAAIMEYHGVLLLPGMTAPKTN